MTIHKAEAVRIAAPLADALDGWRAAQARLITRDTLKSYAESREAGIWKAIRETASNEARIALFARLCEVDELMTAFGLGEENHADANPPRSAPVTALDSAQARLAAAIGRCASPEAVELLKRLAEQEKQNDKKKEGEDGKESV
jgi:hypothetical protein